MLSSLLRQTPKDPIPSPSPEDLFQSSLGLIFTDDLQNQHGDPGTIVTYRSNGYGDLQFEVADPEGEEERTKFAHYLWNSGVLLGEIVGGSTDGDVGSIGQGEEWGLRTFNSGRDWWLSEDEEKLWSVEEERVLELGAGVGLTGIVSVLAGAEEVTITDYPSPAILSTLRTNVSTNIPPELREKVTVQGYQWGDLCSSFATSKKESFTRILAADTLWLTSQHDNLAASMVHLLSKDEGARVFLVAGFHTGRAKVAAFFEESVPEQGLEVEDIWEMDADGVRRAWDKEREEGIGERKKWCVLARLKRKKEE